MFLERLFETREHNYSMQCHQSNIHVQRNRTSNEHPRYADLVMNTQLADNESIKWCDSEYTIWLEHNINARRSATADNDSDAMKL